jgi:hypothetical protein
MKKSDFEAKKITQQAVRNFKRMESDDENSKPMRRKMIMQLLRLAAAVIEKGTK